MAEFYAFIDFHKPDIVIGTESWLYKEILDCEIFLAYILAYIGYNPPIRKDRPGDTKGGGVFILVSQKLCYQNNHSFLQIGKSLWMRLKPSLLGMY